MTTSPASFAPSLGADLEESGRQLLSPAVRGGLLALVVFFHVGIGWALTQVEPGKLVVGEAAAMEVRMVSAAQPASPQPETPPLQLETPLPEDTPPPEPRPQLESMIPPPMPDLPPPVFPVDAPPPPPKPKPPPPKPRPAPAAPVDTTAQAAAPSAAAPKAVPANQIAYLDRPRLVYPARSRRDGEKGTALVLVLIDVAGRPAEVSLQKSSNFAALDAEALRAMRAARFRPYAEGGVPRAVWVVIPAVFNLMDQR